MTRPLAERLEALRRHYYVGRTQERDLLRTALTAEELPFVLLYIYGPGGVGKTSFLREARHIAGQMAIPVYPLDGRHVEPSPAGFLAAWQQLLDVAEPEQVYARLGERSGRSLILIDTAELLVPLEGWLHDTFLPQLPASTLVILAARHPPSLRWRTDIAWQQLMRVIPLRNLSLEESRAFLLRRQIPAPQHEAILNFTRGHPLALSLIADVFAQQPETHFQPENAPNMIKTLLDQFMHEAPSPRHRDALEACAQVRLLSEPLLQAILPGDDVHTLFEWLRGLSFIEAERRGLYPHDLAREVLVADLRWRDPQRQQALHTLARTYYVDHFHNSDARQQRQFLSDYIFLHRDNPIIRSYFDWQSTGTVFTDSYQAADREPLLEMIRRHEGETAVTLADYWLTRQPEGMAVIRHAAGEPQGLLYLIALDRCSDADRERDTAVAAAWRYLQQHAPLRPGETATLFRFWMAADSYQAISPVQSRIFLNMVQHYLTRPNLAFTLIATADPEQWGTIFGFADIHRLPAADFTQGGRSYGLYGHDWRVVPPLIWLANMAEREFGHDAAVIRRTGPPAPAAARLDEQAFATAVLEALRGYNDDVALQASPLLHSHLIQQAAAAPADVSARVSLLRDLLQEAIATLQHHPKQVKWQRALHHTYIQPAATQEQAAELLDLPFSTYRRYLRAAVQHITHWLWSREANYQK